MMDDFEENIEKIKKIKRTKQYKKIENAIMDQLERNGNDAEYYVDLAKDYMKMYCTKQLLNEDIEERGVRVFYNNGGGQTGYKKNDSVDQILKINAQMLKLLSEIGISPQKVESFEEDEL